MIVKSLKLNQFRNYESLQLSFDKGTNLFYGNNAQGKTNILEAVYLCGTTKSHKGSKDREMIRFGEEEAHIRMAISRSQSAYEIDMHLKKNRPKGIAVNGVPIRKAAELLGIANFVFFSPEDLGIIKNGPAERRRFIDMELCQLDKLYLHELSNYNKVIIQRNKLLKECSFNSQYEEMLDIWDMQLVKYGKKLIESRERFVEELGVIVAEIHRNLTGGREELMVRYEKNVSADEFERKLQTSRKRDPDRICPLQIPWTWVYITGQVKPQIVNAVFLCIGTQRLKQIDPCFPGIGKIIHTILSACHMFMICICTWLCRKSIQFPVIYFISILHL